MSTSHNTAEYLLRSSNAGLESFQLSHLARSANLRKDLLRIVNDIVRSEAQARAAHWLRGSRSAGNAPSETSAEMFPALDGDSGIEAASHVAISLAETRSEALPAAGKQSEPQSAPASDSFSRCLNMTEPIEPSQLAWGQLQLFSCSTPLAMDNLTHFDDGSESKPPAERQLLVAPKISDLPARRDLLDAAGIRGNALGSILRLTRFKELNRLSLNWPKPPRDSPNDARKMNVVIFPISAGNEASSGTNVVSRATRSGAMRFGRKSASLFRRPLRKKPADVSRTPLLFPTRCPPVNSFDFVPVETHVCARRA